MEDKKLSLEQKLQDSVNTVVEMCSDKTKAKELLLDIVYTKGLLDIEPIELDCGKKLDEYLGKTFRITKTDKGMLFHEYGGYSVFARNNINSLSTNLEMMMNTFKDTETPEFEKKSEEEQQQTLSIMSAMTMCLKAPQMAFADANFMFKLATDMVDLLLKWQEENQGAVADDDDPEDLEYLRDTLNLFSEEESLNS